MSEKRLMTPMGLKKVQSELEELKSLRPIIAGEIDAARQLGDLSENADYHAAKEKSGLNEAKIRDLEARLSDYEVVDPLKLSSPEKVVFGVTVDLEDLDSGESKTISIYGDEESDPKNGIISYKTPFAKGLFGKAEGDVATIKLPAGIKEYEILTVRVDYKG